MLGEPKSLRNERLTKEWHGFRKSLLRLLCHCLVFSPELIADWRNFKTSATRFLMALLNSSEESIESTESVARRVILQMEDAAAPSQELDTLKLPAQQESVAIHSVDRTTDSNAKQTVTSVDSKSSSSQSPQDFAPSTSRMAEEEFLRQMREHTSRRDGQLVDEVGRLSERERTEFRFFVVLSVLTLVFIAGAAALVMSGRVLIGVVSSVVGLFTGAATKTMNSVMHETNRRREDAAAVRDDNIRTLQAIQGAMLVTDPHVRDHEVSSLAAWLRDRAYKAK